MAGQATIGHRERHGQTGDHEHVSDAMEYKQSLSDHREWPRDEVGPDDSGTVKGCKHDTISKAQLSENITSRGCIDLNWERGTLVHARELT